MISPISTRAWLALAAFSLILASGCVAGRKTDPGRSAVEQLLISTAIDRSVARLRVADLKDRSVFIDADLFKAYDGEYAQAALRNHLRDAGARVLDSADGAEVVIELRSGVLSIDSSEFFLGLPAIPLPAGPTGLVVNTPALPLLERISQEGLARIAGDVRDSEGRRVLVVEPQLGRSYYDRWRIFLLGFARTDIPEKRSED